MADLPLSMRVNAVETGRGRGVKRPRNEEVFRSSGRKDSNAPAEVSSKRRVPIVSDSVTPKGQAKARGSRTLLLSIACRTSFPNTDPRFLATAGQFNETIFRNSYKFLDEMRVSDCQMNTATCQSFIAKPCRTPRHKWFGNRSRRQRAKTRVSHYKLSCLSCARRTSRAVVGMLLAVHYLQPGLLSAKQLPPGSRHPSTSKTKLLSNWPVTAKCKTCVSAVATGLYANLRVNANFARGNAGETGPSWAACITSSSIAIHVYLTLGYRHSAST